MLFGFAILATALLLSMVAAYYSVAGLVAIFSAATIPVIIMGGSLELGKIVATVWLHNNWRRAGWAFKAYLVPAVAFLMLLTSMGIFGYLSKAHSDQSLISGDSIAKVAIYDEKIKISKENIDANRKALKQLDDAVDQVMARSQDEKGADKAVAIRRSQSKERARLIADIEAEQKKITSLNEERAPLAAEFRKIEAEVGPIKYIAALVYGDNPDANVLEKAVRLVIIMIVLVFDPLALTLILAANKQFEWARHGSGGWVHDEEKEFQQALDQKRAVAQALDSGSDLPPEDTKTVQIDEPAPHHPDTHPYLRQGFKYPENWPFGSPMVANPEPAGTPVFVNPPEVWPNEKDLHAYDDQRLVSNEDKKILAAGVDVADRPGDYLPTDDEHDGDESPEIKAAKALWKKLNPDDTLKNQRVKLSRGLISELPWISLLKETASGFGPDFPVNPGRGDTFVRTDSFPTKKYKFTGNDWILIDNSLTDNYTYDTAYIDHLIEKISTGEYDPDLLSDNEREQVAERLNQSKA